MGSLSKMLSNVAVMLPRIGTWKEAANGSSTPFTFRSPNSPRVQAPRADVVLTNKPAIADHVGKQDCCQATLHALLRHRVPCGSIRRAVVVDRR